jgi:membrane protease YdiL (CAAX protease family)
VNDHNHDDDRWPVEPGPGLWAAWGAGGMSIWAVGLLIANLLLQTLLFLLTGHLFATVLAASVIGILLPCHFLARSWGGTLGSEFKVGRVQPGQAAWAGLAALGALIPTSFLANLSVQVYPVPESWLAFQREHLPDTPIETVAVVLTVVVVVPVAEELLFRGIVHRLLARRFRPWLAAVLSALAFAVAHFEPWYVLGLFGLGLLLAFVFETTRSVTACAVTHGVHNAISFVFLTDEQTEAPAPLAITTGDLQLLAGSLLLLWFACRRLLGSRAKR